MSTEQKAQQHRERMAERSREQSRSVSDIGDIPAVVNPERREACRLDLRRFLVTYFPASTGLSPFSADHDRVIEREQQCVLQSGRFVNAVYRGFAKTTIAENTSLWATLYGHRRFVPIFGADGGSADESLRSIKFELEDNELLYEDFPEICHAVRHLEGAAQRATKQMYQGERTHIEWTAERIRFPTIPGAAGSGAVICTRGITAGFRGLKVKLADGTQQRPDFVILDDPQTDESARTPGQVAKTLNTLRKAILKLGGHRRQLAVICNATVIEIDDAVDKLLADPAWQGERIAMVKRWPEAHESHWLDRYAELRRRFKRDSVDDQKRAHREATEYYRVNREVMDKGGEVSWESCYDPDTELSALQHAYNILIDDGEAAFASECQQQPLAPAETEDQPVASAIIERVNCTPRGKVPQWCTRLTSFIDVQQTVLFYGVCGWGDDFTGAVLDYGTYPDQKKQYFTLREAKYTLALATKVAGLEAQIYAGLERLTDELLGAEWAVEGSGTLRIERCLIDANWGLSTAVVKKFCRQSKHAAVLMPSHGKFVGASSPRITDRKPKPGERAGSEWFIQAAPTKGTVRAVLFDANYWKSFVHSRLATPMGGKGGISLFGDKPEMHQMFADHLCAETRVRVEGRGRVVDEWKGKPTRADNHWLDCLVGCAVGASLQGVALAELPATKRPDRKTISYADMYKRARGAEKNSNSQQKTVSYRETYEQARKGNQ